MRFLPPRENGFVTIAGLAVVILRSSNPVALLTCKGYAIWADVSKECFLDEEMTGGKQGVRLELALLGLSQLNEWHLLLCFAPQNKKVQLIWDPSVTYTFSSSCVLGLFYILVIFDIKNQ